MLRDMDLGAKDGDLIFPITNVGKPPPYNHELSTEDWEKAEVAMKKIRSFHLQAVYNAGGVRQVDWILAELLMAQFTRVNLMIGEDLNTSLQELFSVVEESGKTLLGELKTALGPTVSNLVPYNLQWVVESHNSCLYMSLTKVLVFLDCARWEGCDFLEDRVRSLQSDEEFKKLITSLSEQISAFEDHVWELALLEELAEEEVALCVNLALTATRPIVGNYFSRVLEALVRRLGIKVHEDENPPHSTQEGLEQCLTEELWQSSTSASSLEGCESQGLHVGYSLDYADSGKGSHVPALSSYIIPNLLDAIDHLQLGVCPPPKEGDPPKEQQDLLESLAVKDVPKPSDPKDIYQKFLNTLGEWLSVQNPDPALEPGNPTPNLTVRNPPTPPGQANTPQSPGHVGPPLIQGSPQVLTGSLGRSPLVRRDQRSCSPTEILCTTNRPCLHQKSLIPSYPSLVGTGSRWRRITRRWLQWIRRSPSPSEWQSSPGSLPGDLSTSSQEAAKLIRNVLCPSRLPWRDLKYMDDKRTILDPAGHPIGSLRLTDVVKSKKGLTSRAAKHKEPDTPDLGSRGALDPIRKQVKFEGVTFHHGSTPSIHVGASLHDMEEKD